MATRRISLFPWNDKLDRERAPVVKHLAERFVDIPAGSAMLIASPRIFDDYLRAIPRGESRTMRRMRRDVAESYGADDTCPVSTGLFVKIVAEAAYEKVRAGVDPSRVTPFWRVVDETTSVGKKLSFGLDFVREQREREGIGRCPPP